MQEQPTLDDHDRLEGAILHRLCEAGPLMEDEWRGSSVTTPKTA
jgi:hypothetical protein